MWNKVLSNFFKTRIEVDGLVYPSVENAYQALKCEYPAQRNQFTRCSPAQAKRLGRKVTMRHDFDRDAEMRRCLRLKWLQPAFREYLKSTGSEELVEENTWGDVYWGVCNGKGENKLGKLIMEIREEIKEN